MFWPASTFETLPFFYAVRLVEKNLFKKRLQVSVNYKTDMLVALIMQRIRNAFKKFMNSVHLGGWNSYVQPCLFYRIDVVMFRVCRDDRMGSPPPPSVNGLDQKTCLWQPQRAFQMRSLTGIRPMTKRFKRFLRYCCAIWRHFLLIHFSTVFQRTSFYNGMGSSTDLQPIAFHLFL